MRTAFDELYTKEKELNDLYTKYAENGDDALLEKAGKVQTYLEENNFYDLAQSLLQSSRITSNCSKIDIDNTVSNSA